MESLARPCKLNTSQTFQILGQPVNPKGNQPWMFTGRTVAEAETPILWPPDAESWLIGKDPDAGKDWGQEEKGATEDEMAGWHHRLDGHGFGWTLRAGVGQDSWGSLGLQGDPFGLILKEISPGCPLEGLMLKLKLQYFGHLMQRADSLALGDWRQEETGTTEGETAGWCHRLKGHEFR